MKAVAVFNWMCFALAFYAEGIVFGWWLPLTILFMGMLLGWLDKTYGRLAHRAMNGG